MYGKQGGFVSSRSRSRLVFWLWMLAVVLVQFGCNQSQPTEKLDDEPALSREHTEKVLEKDNPRVNRAVVIGINNYGEGFKQLKRAVNDARGIRNILVDEFGYDSTFVTYLENQSASLSRVKNTLTQMSQSLDANDTILFFFAGHGGRDGWLAMADSVFDQETTTWLSVPWLISTLKSFPCDHKLVILDSCYSGALFTAKRQGEQPPASNNMATESKTPATTRGGSINQSDIIADYMSEPSFLGISAGRNQAVVDEMGQNGHSLFTWALLESMRQRALMNRKDQVFLGRILAADVERRVASIRNSPQRVDWGYLDDGRGDFVFVPTRLRETPAQLSESRRKKLKVRQFVKDLGAAKLALDEGDRQAALQIIEPHMRDAELAKRFDGRFIRNLARSGPEKSIQTKAESDLFKLVKLPTEFGNHRYQYRCTAISNDGKLLAAAEYVPLGHGGAFKEKRVVVFDSSGNIVAKYDNHITDISGLAFSPDGTQLAVARSKPIEFAGSNRELSAKEKQVASDIRIYEPKTKTIKMTLPAPEHDLEGLAYSPDGAILVAGHNPHRIDMFVSNHTSSVSFYDIWTGQRTFKMDVRSFEETGQPPAVRRLKFSKLGDELAVADDADRQIWLAKDDLPATNNSNTASIRKENRSFKVGGAPAWISDDGRVVGTLNFQTSLQGTTANYRRYDTHTHKIVGSGSEHVAHKDFKDVQWVQVRNGFLAFQASKEKSKLNRPKEYLIWKLGDKGIAVHKWIPNRLNLADLVFSPDGALFILKEKDRGFNYKYSIWSSVNGDKICDLASKSTSKRDFRWSQDSRKVFAEGDQPNQVAVWDATSGREVDSYGLWGSAGVLNSFQGTNVVLSYNDSAFTLFAGRNQKNYITAKLPKFCTGVYVDPSLRRAVSRHQDNTLFSWDFQIGTILSPLELPEFQTPDLVKLSNDNEVVVVGFDGWVSRLMLPELSSDQVEQLLSQPTSIRRPRKTENREVDSNSIYRLITPGSSFVRNGLSPDQSTVALRKLKRQGNKNECQIIIVETFSGREVGKIITGKGWPSSVALGENKSGRFCVYYLDGKLNLRNLETGVTEELRIDFEGAVYACGVDATGTLIATASTKNPKSNDRSISIFDLKSNTKSELGELRACSELKFENGKLVCSGLNSYRPKTVWQLAGKNWKKEAVNNRRNKSKRAHKVILTDKDQKPLLFINQSFRLDGEYLNERPELRNRRANNGCMTSAQRLFLLVGKKLYYEVEGLAEMKFFSLPVSTTAAFLHLSSDESTLAIGDRGKLLLIDVAKLR